MVVGLVVAVLRGRVGEEERKGSAVEVGREVMGLSEVMVGGNGSLEGFMNASMRDIPLDGEGEQKFGGPPTNTVTTTSATLRGSNIDAEATLRLFDEL